MPFMVPQQSETKTIIGKLVIYEPTYSNIFKTLIIIDSKKKTVIANIKTMANKIVLLIKVCILRY